MRLLGYEAVAEMLHIPVGTLKYWRKVGKGPDVILLEGTYKYDEADVLRYCAERRRVRPVQASKRAKHGALQAKA